MFMDCVRYTGKVFAIDFDFIVVTFEKYGGGHNAYEYGGHPAPDGASPTQPYKCSQYFKVKTVLKFGFDVDFDFKHFDCIYKVG